MAQLASDDCSHLAWGLLTQSERIHKDSATFLLAPFWAATSQARQQSFSSIFVSIRWW